MDSKAASFAKGAGTKIIDAFTSVLSLASSIESKTGTPQTSCPPLPGVTPATILVLYLIICSVWN